MLHKKSLYQKNREKYWEAVNKEQERWDKYLWREMDLQSYMAMVMCRPEVVKLSTAYELTLPKGC